MLRNLHIQKRIRINLINKGSVYIRLENAKCGRTYSWKKSVYFHLKNKRSLALVHVRKKQTETTTGETEPCILQRSACNPILSPNSKNKWESSAVFNSAVIYLGNQMHFIYRAIGESGLSVLGYAASNDGTHICYRSSEPVFVCDDLPGSTVKTFVPYPYSSGGSWWGAEDPRLSRVGDTIYMTYTAFDGCNPPAVALTSISVTDFLNRTWNWEKSKIISQPGITNKNWVLFPEKINGKYALLHSITPGIMIDYEDSLAFTGDRHIKSCHYSKGRDQYWDNWVRGAGPPPIKTREGWLLFYHAMDKNDPGKYKIGAMLLDEKNPEIIVHRSPEPLLEPYRWYENDGHKKGVVYTCGAAVIGTSVYLYYGGSDSFVCVSVAETRALLQHLKGSRKQNKLFTTLKFQKNDRIRTH